MGADRRKSEPERRRMKAVGGGKMVPAAPYKDRKDIGTQRQRSTREQQPEQVVLKLKRHTLIKLKNAELQQQEHGEQKASVVIK